MICEIGTIVFVAVNPGIYYLEPVFGGVRQYRLVFFKICPDQAVKELGLL